MLAYSGGLDTSIILKWLQTEIWREVVTFTADLGNRIGRGWSSDEPRKAENLGIKEIYIEDRARGIRARFRFPDVPRQCRL